MIQSQLSFPPKPKPVSDALNREKKRIGSYNNHGIMEPSSNEKMSRSRLCSKRRRKISEDKKLSRVETKKKLLKKSEEESDQQNKFQN